MDTAYLLCIYVPMFSCVSRMPSGSTYLSQLSLAVYTRACVTLQLPVWCRTVWWCIMVPIYPTHMASVALYHVSVCPVLSVIPPECSVPLFWKLETRKLLWDALDPQAMHARTVTWLPRVHTPVLGMCLATARSHPTQAPTSPATPSPL